MTINSCLENKETQKVLELPSVKTVSVWDGAGLRIHEYNKKEKGPNRPNIK